jgi:hypothetical protein
MSPANLVPPHSYGALRPLPTPPYTQASPYLCARKFSLNVAAS